MESLDLVQLESGLDYVCQSPKDVGTLELIVRRPREDEREVLEQGELSPADGLVGDNWKLRGSSPHPDRQITLTNSRLVALLAQDRQFWPLAGDQLYVDLDLSLDNLPLGTHLAIGSALLEVTEPPHRGCSKFSSRFGLEALKFISAPERKHLRLRGIYARVVKAGIIRVGNRLQKI